MSGSQLPYQRRTSLGYRESRLLFDTFLDRPRMSPTFYVKMPIRQEPGNWKETPGRKTGLQGQAEMSDKPQPQAVISAYSKPKFKEQGA